MVYSYSNELSVPPFESLFIAAISGTCYTFMLLSFMPSQHSACYFCKIYFTTDMNKSGKNIRL